MKLLHVFFSVPEFATTPGTSSTGGLNGNSSTSLTYTTHINLMCLAVSRFFL